MKAPDGKSARRDSGASRERCSRPTLRTRTTDARSTIRALDAIRASCFIKTTEQKQPKLLVLRYALAGYGLPAERV
jgi:hypothetical protein